jgi:hypothetical protein|tara:strand:- start:1471 stop:2340 length:870 start_codon:yes stop_codon:yes gene_type:complete
LQKIKVNLLSDLWSVTIGIHYIYTTTHPLLYLKELSPRVTNPYFNKYKWPNIDESESYFNKNNLSIYNSVKKWLHNTLHNSIFNEFEKTINYGYNNPVHRSTYNEWEKVLKSVQAPPIINLFVTDRNTIIKGISINLEWDVENAYKIELNHGIGEVTAKGKKELNLNDNTVLRLTAIGYFGSVDVEIPISVFPTPIIKSLSIPSPDFRQNVVLKIATPKFNHTNSSSININNSINLSNHKIENIQYSQNIVFPINEIKRIKTELNQQTLRFKLLTIYEKIKNRLAQSNR